MHHSLQNMCLFYPSWEATSFERPPSWVAFIKGLRCNSLFFSAGSIVCNACDEGNEDQDRFTNDKESKVWYGTEYFCHRDLHQMSHPDTHFYPSALRAGGVLSSRSGRAGGCQTCGTHISVTAWRIFSFRSSVELSRPVGLHCHGHMPICPIWACPWVKNLSNLPQIGSRLCGMHISETAVWIYPI